MSGGAVTALGISQWLGLVGYVGVGGLVMFRALVIPEREPDRRVLRAAVAGLALITLAVAVRALVVLTTGSATELVGFAVPVLIVQLGAVVAVGCYLPDLFGSPLTRWRRGTAVAAAVLLALALVLPFIVGPRALPALGGVVSAAHVLTVGTWIGGMLAIALVVLPTSSTPSGVLGTVQSMLRRSETVVLVLVALLVVTGVLAILLQPRPTDGLGAAYWTVLVIKIVLLTGLVAATAHVRRQIQRAAFRIAHVDEVAGQVGLAPLRRIVTLEIAVAAAAVAATAALVVLTPLA